MTDTDLDRRVAKIVGWTRASAHDPTGCIEDAIAALEAMQEKGWAWEINCSVNPLHVENPFACVIHRMDEEEWATGCAETLPLAICKAIVATEEEK